MKKFILVALLIVLSITQNQVFGAPHCPGSTISFQSLQDADDNEFMYTSMDAFNEANDYESENGGELTEGRFYECDNEQGCAHGKYFLTTADSVFKGEKTNDMQLYSCTFMDKWAKQTLWQCTDLPKSYTDYTESIVNLDGRDFMYIYDKNKKAYCYFTGEILNCFEAQKRGEPANWNGTSCNCGDVQVWDSKQGKCINKNPSPNTNPDTTKKCPNGYDEKITSEKDCKNNETFECAEKDGKNCKCGKCNSNNNEYIGKCHPSVCKSEICKACCAKPASETIWDRTAQTCHCVNGGKFIKENNNQWICKIESNQSVDVYKCDEALMAKLSDWKSKCTKHANALKEIEDLETYCKGQPDKDVFLRLYNSTQQIVNTTCINDSNVNITIDVSEQTGQVNSAYSQLTAIHNKFRDNVSVWKDAEGNFNTARLASDTVAGVVLGTAGGLITSSVVKKNQVEDGFEDIKCTIGGQNVAGWGDQFRVGIQ